MNPKMTRRIALTAGLATAGAVVGVRLDDEAAERSSLGRSAILSASRKPLQIAMLDQHANRLLSVIPELETVIQRQVTIEALTFDQLYSNFAIDLLHQTGRYDVVSMCDAWMPFFGQEGYFSNVEMGDEVGGDRTYPVRVLEAATGIDGTPLIAHPWTMDFACSALKAGELVFDWVTYSRALEDDPGIRVAIPAESGTNAANAFRALALAFGQDVINAETHEPGLNTYGSNRAMAILSRLATRADVTTSLARTWSQMPALGIAGDVDYLPLILASDLGGLVVDPAWSVQLLPEGRVNRRRTSGQVWMLAVPAGAPALEEARVAVRWFTSTEIQQRLWSEASLLPVTRPAINAPWPKGSERMRLLMLDALDALEPIPRLRSFQYVMELIGELIPAVLQDPANMISLMADSDERARAILFEEGELAS